MTRSEQHEWQDEVASWWCGGADPTALAALLLPLGEGDRAAVLDLVQCEPARAEVRRALVALEAVGVAA